MQQIPGPFILPLPPAGPTVNACHKYSCSLSYKHSSVGVFIPCKYDCLHDASLQVFLVCVTLCLLFVGVQCRLEMMTGIERYNFGTPGMVTKCVCRHLAFSLP